MKPIAESDIRRRLERDNPWWSTPLVELPESSYPRRVYFAPFKAQALNFKVRRAVILLGPRRVGKTVMIRQLIKEALDAGIPHNCILYASIDAPVYSGIPLEKIIEFMPADSREKAKLIIFDEIQYLVEWERHLKDLVDHFPGTKFIASGSATAALKLKSRESGAGRFTDFMLPPLTFYEYLCFTKEDEKLIVVGEGWYNTSNIDRLNALFIEYLNFGGYPEVVLNSELRKDPERYIKNDIIDKVLLKDLPSLYGIEAIQELNRLFSYLAFNAGSEGSLENISQQSGLAKPTIKKYIEYLESAFLLIKIGPIDENCKAYKRERNFKVYLNNPSMRAALFAPAQADDRELIGHLAESAIFSQWQHSSAFRNLKYARWRNEGEVDIVYLSPGDQLPSWAVEIKWSDRVATRPIEETKSLQTILNKHKASMLSACITTKTFSGPIDVSGHKISAIPSSLYCYTIGRNVTDKFTNAGEESE